MKIITNQLESGGVVTNQVEVPNGDVITEVRNGERFAVDYQRYDGRHPVFCETSSYEDAEKTAEILRGLLSLDRFEQRFVRECFR